jgi:hypothetical protein
MLRPTRPPWVIEAALFVCNDRLPVWMGIVERFGAFFAPGAKL